ncbi:MAG: hypothetical protein H0Z35_12705 [Thermoanaerobacteraceae bacterium]|nr:hypothetical protein [Thermoanaerobacteraceae bacterium]
MEKDKLTLKRNLDKPVKFFTFDLGKKMEEKIILPEEEKSPWEVLTEKIIWDPGRSD